MKGPDTACWLRHRWPFALIRILLLLVLVCGAVAGSFASEMGSQLYIGHRARLTAQIPATWTVSAQGLTDYSGPDGFVTSTRLVGDTLDEVCGQFARGLHGESAPATWQGEDACHIDGEVDGMPATGLVVPHPSPFSDGIEHYQYVAIMADPAHFPAIASSMSFDPGLVTPHLYVASVLDLLEARAWYADDVDWDRLREDPLGLVANAETLGETHWVIRDALTQLRYAGDNHSFFLDQGTTLYEDQGEGYGMMVDGRVVVLVYPDGPAAHAGIRTGDSIVSVDDKPFSGFPYLTDPSYGWIGPVTLSLLRSGIADPLVVQLDPGPFSTYLPPIATALPGDIGYIELFTTLGADRVHYAADANAGVARVDAQGACGWIVDLRRNGGGGYGPMVTGVSEILGDGTILTFVNRDGDVVFTIDLRDGRIYQNGQYITEDLSGVPLASLDSPNPPVALLVGPGTGSAGEVTALAFVGRPETRIFGERTGGYTVGNTGYTLFDGAHLGLAELANGDRNGKPHVDGVEPDVMVSADWTVYGTANDPAIQMASAWLSQQPACAPTTSEPASPEAN